MVLANGINDVPRSINLGNNNVAERNCKLFIGTSKALPINSRYPQKPKLLVKHSRHLQETFYA
jgi:TorA maturation chaperone TorD